MRTDINVYLERIKLMDVKPNYSELARRFNCDRRTIKNHFENSMKERKPQNKGSKLNDYKEIINEKVDLGANGVSIFKFIQKRGYMGKYTILREYIKNYKGEKTKKATIRIETTPGLQAQLDWKENLKLFSKHGELFSINVFLLVLGYSRKKYIELTINREQQTLFNCLINAFNFFQGVPHEIWVDNMKTIVNQHKFNASGPIYNERFQTFSKDMGFETIACRPYRPQTKGKVETVAKLMNRLLVFNNEFETLEDLTHIVNEFLSEINNEVSQATNKIPNQLYEKEKEHLLPLPNESIMKSYLEKPIFRKVSHESMIEYKGNKYSVPVKYLYEYVEIKVIEDILHIYYNKNQIACHKISSNTFNYQYDHVKEILRSDAFKFKSDDELDIYIRNNLNLMDKI